MDLKRVCKRLLGKRLPKRTEVWSTHISSAESMLSSYVGVKHGLLTSMGRTALIVALKALGVDSGDSVIVPSFTCNIVVKAVEYCDAKTIFADVDPLTFNLDPSEVKRKVTENTKAVLIIHCYGQPADMNELLEIAKESDLRVIEDGAHAFGAEYHGKKVGGFGDFSIFSLSKNLGCSSGGALATDSASLMSKAREALAILSAGERPMNRWRHRVTHRILSKGREKRALFSSLKLLGVARRLVHSRDDTIPDVFSADDDITKEFVDQLRVIDYVNAERRRKARILTELIADLKTATPPYEKRDREHVYYIYGLQVRERKEILKRLKKTARYTFLSLPWQCPYGENAMELSQSLVLFEMDPNLTDDNLHLIASALSNAFQN